MGSTKNYFGKHTAIQPPSKKSNMRRIQIPTPMKTKLHGITNNRIKQESFLHKNNTLYVDDRQLH